MTTQDQLDSRAKRKLLRTAFNQDGLRVPDPRSITKVPVIARKYAKQHNKGIRRAIEQATKVRTPEDEARLAAAQAKRDRKAGKK